MRGLGPKKILSIYQGLRNSLVTEEDVVQLDWSEFQRRLPNIGKDVFEALRKTDNGTLYSEYQRLLAEGVHIVHLGHELYPPHLVALLGNSAPPILFCRGEASLLTAKSVAIQGSRDASQKGLNLAAQFAAELALQDVNVISGYAKGIDTNAHLGALEKGGTSTIVLSFGIYQFSKKKAFQEVQWRDNVLAVSQFHPREVWRTRNAMMRNSVICALSQAVIVIEAGQEGGTFNAGKTALSLGLPLFVVTPSIFEKVPIGNRELISMGAQEIHPDDGTRELVSKVRNYQPTAKTSVPPEQMPLFAEWKGNGS